MQRKMRNCAVVLAAGKGSRMKSSTPKVFQDIAGLPVLGHIIRALQQCNFNQRVVVLSEHGSLDVLPEKLRNMDIARQYFQDGTGGAVRQAMQVIDNNTDYILVLYGDTPLISPTSINSALECAIGSDIHVLTIRINAQNSYGKLSIDALGNVTEIIECNASQIHTSDLCNVGMIVKKDILNKYVHNLPLHESKKEFFLTDIIALAYKDGHKCTYSELPAEEMHGINTMSDLAEVEEIYQNKRREYFMARGVKLVAPNTVFFAYDTEIENDVVVKPYVIFGTGVHIKKGTIIEAFCHITGANVDSASVGPFSRLRPGTKLNNGSKVGNFVELKNSEISEGTKVNHLSYIGDTSVGRNTNIGAGTITCNYDGHQKFKTIIGEQVFIGSNTALVAPLTVGNGALIGAGSTITENVQENAIAIARSPQNELTDAALKYHKRRNK